MKRWMIAALLTVFCSPAFSTGQIARVEVVDSASGRTLPVYSSGGRYFGSHITRVFQRRALLYCGDAGAGIFGALEKPLA